MDRHSPDGPVPAHPDRDGAGRATPRPSPARPEPPARTGLSWPLVLGLGAFALLRPLASITGISEAVGNPAAALGLTLIITLGWVGVVTLGRIPRPVLTLTLAGVAYGVYAVLISLVLSPMLTGEVQGPATAPFAVVAVLVTNAIWGAVAGLLAAGLQQLRGGVR